MIATLNFLLKVVSLWLLVFGGVLRESAAQAVEVTPVGQWSVFPMGGVPGIAISSNYAYLANGFHVIDISNPANPVFVGSASTAGSSIAISGSYGYLVNYLGLKVIDISNPTNPMVVGGTNLNGSAQDIAVSGNYAYVAASGGGGLHVIDISNPATPVRVGGTNTSGAGLSVTISGNYAYVGAGFSLQVFNVSNPPNPILVASLYFGSSPRETLI